VGPSVFCKARPPQLIFPTTPLKPLHPSSPPPPPPPLRVRVSLNLRLRDSAVAIFHASSRVVPPVAAASATAASLAALQRRQPLRNVRPERAPPVPRDCRVAMPPSSCGLLALHAPLQSSTCVAPPSFCRFTIPQRPRSRYPRATAVLTVALQLVPRSRYGRPPVAPPWPRQSRHAALQPLLRSCYPRPPGAPPASAPSRCAAHAHHSSRRCRRSSEHVATTDVVCPLP